VAVIERMLEDPASLGGSMATVQVPCAELGRLVPYCRAAGLTLLDRFDGVLVASVLFCEPCGTPVALPLVAIATLHQRGPIETGRFWDGALPVLDRSQPPAGFDLIAAGTLDPFTQGRIAGLTSGLEATHLLEFRSRVPATEDRAIGFLLFVDPAAERPIIGIEPTTPTWTAAEYRQVLGNWRPLYERP
jgi:hypothetical protein